MKKKEPPKLPRLTIEEVLDGFDTIVEIWGPMLRERLDNRSKAAEANQ